MDGVFKDFAANENNPKWANMIKREKELYSRGNDIRSEFERDYTRVIHSTAYRRLKHKTQVYFSPSNDHICTRVEHVAHVELISYTIAKYLGLNTELTKAIATAHDIGHSPFGHQGEKILSEITKREIGESFWHERNGLEIVDKIELLEDNQNNLQNLNLTYSVRDGIISHCGEIDENELRPRDEFIDLYEYKRPNQFSPYTWEGCVVKIADKISYLGRDIQDAITIGILDEHLDELREVLKLRKDEVINNTVIIKELIYDLCNNSSPEKGLCFSEEVFNKINEIKKFNYKYIYLSDRLMPSTEYFGVVINQLFNTLKSSYRNREKIRKMYPGLIDDFYRWLSDYAGNGDEKMKNDVIFDLDSEEDFVRAIVFFIAGMTDNYAIGLYNGVIGF